MSIKTKAVLFDRDGTLNKDVDYLYRISDFSWTEDARGALQWLAHMGMDLFVITNQSGIARGYFTLYDMHRLHRFMNDELAKSGAKIKKFYYCPHLPEADIAGYAKVCECRKPKPGLVLQCLTENNLLPDECIMIGDKERDVECARAAGVKGYLYQGGSLLEFVKQIVGCSV